MKETIIRLVNAWIYQLIEEIKKEPVQKLLLIFISPILIYMFAKALMSFSILSTIGYVVACVYGFTKIIRDPYRIIKWGAGYAIGTSAFNLIITSFIPMISKGTATDIFASMIVLYVIVTLSWEAYKLKKA